MPSSRKSTSSRSKAKKTTRPAKAARKPAASARATRSAGAKPAAKFGAKSAAKSGAARPATKAPAKPAAKSAARPAAKRTGLAPAAKTGPRLKPVRRPPAVVHPIGLLPPDAMARTSSRPARPAPAPARHPGPAPVASVDGGALPVTVADYPEFEQRLLEQRTRVLKEMGHYESTVLKVNPRDSAGDLSGYSFHMADVGTDAMEREKAFQLASAEGRVLMEINEALRRIARGEYGVCESCENAIHRARLEAMPAARLCVTCKEKEERANRGMS